MTTTHKTRQITASTSDPLDGVCLVCGDPACDHRCDPHWTAFCDTLAAIGQRLDAKRALAETERQAKQQEAA